MPECEEEADGNGPPALLHERAGDVVDGGDVVGIDRVPEPEAPGEKSRAEEERLPAERHERGDPGRDVEGGEKRVDAEDPALEAVASRVGGDG